MKNLKTHISRVQNLLLVPAFFFLFLSLFSNGASGVLCVCVFVFVFVCVCVCVCVCAADSQTVGALSK